MFDADEALREPFIQDEIVRYKRVAALIPDDMPLIMVAPAFTSTKRGTNRLVNHMDMTPSDSGDPRKHHRWEAYIGSLWVDSPTVVVSLISGNSMIIGDITTNAIIRKWTQATARISHAHPCQSPVPDTYWENG